MLFPTQEDLLMKDRYEVGRLEITFLNHPLSQTPKRRRVCVCVCVCVCVFAYLDQEPRA